MLENVSPFRKKSFSFLVKKESLFRVDVIQISFWTLELKKRPQDNVEIFIENSAR